MEKSMVFTFGRFNPPTNGHILLLDVVMAQAATLQADHAVFMSRTQNSKKDPLDWEFKNRILKLASPNVNVADYPEIKTPFQALEKIANDGYKKVIFVAGSDRVIEFQTSMMPYAKQWGIEYFTVKCAGLRNNFSDDVKGTSSSKLRAHAMHNRFKEFCDGLATGIPEEMQLEIFSKIRETCNEELYCAIT